MSDEMLSQEEIEALLRGETLDDAPAVSNEDVEEEINVDAHLSPI